MPALKVCRTSCAGVRAYSLIDVIFCLRCLALASEVLSNVLFEEIRRKRGLVYGINYGIRPYRYIEAGVGTISFQPKDEEVDESIAAVKETLGRVFKEGFTVSV